MDELSEDTTEVASVVTANPSAVATEQATNSAESRAAATEEQATIEVEESVETDIDVAAAIIDVDCTPLQEDANETVATPLPEDDTQFQGVTELEQTKGTEIDEATATKLARWCRQRSRVHRRRRYASITADSTTSSSETNSRSNVPDDPWWWEIENENLILDQPPNISILTLSTGDESESGRAGDLATLLQVVENVSETTLNAADKVVTSNNNIDHSVREISASITVTEAVPADAETTTTKIENDTDEPDKITSGTSVAREQTLEEFKEELRMKRMTRQSAVQDLRDEIAELRKQLASERASRAHCSHGGEKESPQHRTIELPLDEPLNAVDDGDDEDDNDPNSRSRHANIKLANAQLSLQLANADNLSLRTELGVVQKQVGTLKEVVACCKQMLSVKEEQCSQLKTKLQEIEASFGEREMRIMSDNLRQEYERQLGNIRQLRELYEERQRVSAAEHENLQRLISIKRDELVAEHEKTKTVEESNQALVKEVEVANSELATLREECNEHKFEKKALKEEMGAVNTLFSQMVMGFNGKNNLDIDRLTTMLEENRTLLNDMATKEVNCSDGATLPKLLFELVEQATVADAKGSGSYTPLSMEDEEEAAAITSIRIQHNNKTNYNSVSGDNEPAASENKGNKVRNENENDGEQKVVAQEVQHVAADVAGTAYLPNGITTNLASSVHSVALDKAHLPTSNNSDNREEITKEMAIAAIGGVSTATGGAEEATAVNAATGLGDATSATLGIALKNTKRHNRRNGSAGGGGGGDSLKPALPRTTLKFHETEIIGKVASAQEIIGNLPKVWKVLMELLSHHRNERVQFEENGKGEDCYKSVETSNGPKAELSVSKTYIKLKDLILEKKSLVKETNRLKTLNCHLEYRLNEQEKRLSAVSLELTKTWHLVGKMQRQHRQLHTQEQILRYQLQQKRRLLSELKDELEYCRRKWAAARAKNDESQEQCNDLRREFARRKLKDAAGNNSAESGYSDSGPPSDEDEKAAAALAAVATVGASVPASDGPAAEVPQLMALNHSDDVKGDEAEPAGEGEGEDNSAVDVAFTGNAGVSVTASLAATAGGSCRRRHLKQMFEHTRKIKRMQSTSPGRAGDRSVAGETEAVIVLRWNSAPPTCGWRRRGGEESRNDLEARVADDDGDCDDTEDEDADTDKGPTATRRMYGTETLNRGAIPKSGLRHSRSVLRGSSTHNAVTPGLLAKLQFGISEAGAEAEAVASISAPDTVERAGRASRIQRLEEQCKSLIQQVLETSSNRERLEVQLCRFQDEIAPVQYAVPLNEFINRRRTERMTRASSAPIIGTLTPREEEYTRKRSERLERLEEESRQLLSRIKRTTDRGHYLRCSLDRIRRVPSREDSFESNTEGEQCAEPEAAPTAVMQAEDKTDTEVPATTDNTTSQPSPLTAEEEAFTQRRAARLQRLEEMGKQLIAKISHTQERGSTMESKLDGLHRRYDSERTEEESESEVVGSASIEQRIETIERLSTNREERLRLLEEEGKQLLTRLSNTSERGTRMINRIAEREQRRSERANAATARDDSTSVESTADATTAGAADHQYGGLKSKAEAQAVAEEIPVAAEALLPALKNVACTSIVNEELTDHVTVTTTPSRIATQQGAIPKTKPTSRLHAARTKAEAQKSSRDDANGHANDAESLEQLVKRLQSLPYPQQPEPLGNKDQEEQMQFEDNSNAESKPDTDDAALKSLEDKQGQAELEDTVGEDKFAEKSENSS